MVSSSTWFRWNRAPPGLRDPRGRLLVLTHHNGLTYNGRAQTPLWDQVAGALGLPPDVWSWGHMHNGIAYSAQSASGDATLAQCSGHGGLPFGNAYGLHEGDSGTLISQVDF